MTEYLEYNLSFFSSGQMAYRLLVFINHIVRNWLSYTVVKRPVHFTGLVIYSSYSVKPVPWHGHYDMGDSGRIGESKMSFQFSQNITPFADSRVSLAAEGGLK